MIGSLRGRVLDRSARSEHAAELLVEVGGVGYRVTCPPSTLSDLPVAGEIMVHVHTHVREDAIVLYGFATAEERGCFEALIGAHGVGPSLALAMLSVHRPAALRRAVAAEDLDALSTVPGVGRKTAARLVVELRDRLEPPAGELAGVPTASAGWGTALQEVRSALAGLGYGPEEIRRVVTELPEVGGVEELLRAALRHLAGAR